MQILGTVLVLTSRRDVRISIVSVRESLCVSIVHVACFIRDQSKRPEIFKQNNKIVSLIGEMAHIFTVHVARLIGG